MKLIRRPTILLVALVATFVASDACHVPAVQDAGHIIAVCSAPTVKDVAAHILDDVTSALVSTDYTGGLVAIVTKFMIGVGQAEYAREQDKAWQAVKCAVTEVRNQSGVHLGYGLKDPGVITQEAKVVTNADAWLAAH